jgi:SAM-dependent methyltransferase
MNHYENSWAIYKAHSESFLDDLEYYLKFSLGHKTLVTFAGYGRVVNYLASRGVDLSANELSQDFKKFINLPSEKIHIGNVLDFSSHVKFDRIFAAYNSFCLLLNDVDVKKLFSVFENSLSPGGQVSLSYYHPDSWHLSAPYSFEHDGRMVKYTPSFDLSDRKNQRGIWKDMYEVDGKQFEHEYRVRIYENDSELEKMFSHTKFKIIDVIHDYNNPKIVEPGWIEYVLELSV